MDFLALPDTNNPPSLLVCSTSGLRTAAKSNVKFSNLSWALGSLSNKATPIDKALSYHNDAVYREVGESFEDRKNCTVYNHHDYINNVRRMMHAFEHGDMEKAYSYFDEKARFRNIEMPRDESMTMEESKANLKDMMDKFTVTSIDVVGYPDYLEYDLRDGKTVQSWWNIRLTRKSDDKEIVMPAMYVHDFNDEGKISSSTAYISSKWLD